jgi:hypothetical protein
VNSIVTEKCTTSLDHFLKDNHHWSFGGSDRLNMINLQKSTILLHVSLVRLPHTFTGVFVLNKRAEFTTVYRDKLWSVSSTQQKTEHTC